ncbi:hypothetical protein K438DRAFT_1082659 [Mycena galopus ATCC 62051]|nr:hypothetical protein K438DRAFT_1082659 [Mycena galopus ATCC 62051]
MVGRTLLVFRILTVPSSKQILNHAFPARATRRREALDHVLALRCHNQRSVLERQSPGQLVLDQWASRRSSWTDNDALYVAMKAGSNLGL